MGIVQASNICAKFMRYGNRINSIIVSVTHKFLALRFELCFVNMLKVYMYVCCCAC